MKTGKIKCNTFEQVTGAFSSMNNPTYIIDGYSITLSTANYSVLVNF